MFSAAIIIPTWHYYFDPFRVQPLWELYFATVIDSNLGSQDVKVDVIDLRRARREGCPLISDKIVSYTPRHDLFLYWIVKTADYLEILSIVKKLREVYPKAKHVAGGTHVDNFPEECKKYFDSVIIGPGEESFIKSIKDCHSGLLKKVYLSNWDNIKYADYPIAHREYLPKSSIINKKLFEKYGKVKGTSVQFSRGCNFRCGYCAYNVPNFIQRRDPKAIEKEILYLKNEYGVKGINLRDEICIPLSSKVAIPYIEAIGRTDVIWRGQTRVGAKKEVIQLARKSGCVELAIGAESVSQKVLDIIRKGQSLQQVKDFFKLCKSVGIKTKMCLVFGLPGEPQDIVKRTLSFIEEVKPDYGAVSGLCPIPGSEMFNNQKYYGIKKIDHDWSKHFHLLYRFSDKEDFGLPFEYEKTNKWGKTFSKLEIAENIKKVQHYLREKSMVY